MSENHLMVDLETTSTDTNNTFILTIGAIVFNMNNSIDENSQKNNEKEFYRRIDLSSCYDLEVDILTIEWWMKQSGEARQEAFLEKPRYPLIDVLKEFILFCNQNDITYVWSHGKDFDVVVLQNLFKKYKLKCPWKFYNSRDTRTVYHIADIDYNKINIPGIDDIKHHALFDCKRQILALNLSYSKLK